MDFFLAPGATNNREENGDDDGGENPESSSLSQQVKAGTSMYVHRVHWFLQSEKESGSADSTPWPSKGKPKVALELPAVARRHPASAS